jgi:type I restriction enzyme, S subunit
MKLPENWKTHRLGELFEFSNGINADKSAYGQGTPFVNVLEVITSESLTVDGIPGRIALPKSTLVRYRVNHGDVLFNRTSETQDEVGLSSTYLGDEPVVFGGFVFRAQPKTAHLDVEYSKYCLRGDDVRSQITGRGQGGIRANIGQRDLKSVEVALPDIPEQRAIAEVLDDASALVDCLQALIEKKRDLKQGMMQVLLTGRTRLPGFTGEWKLLPVADNSHLKARIGWQGLTTGEYLTSGEYRLVGGTDFKNGHVDWGSTSFVDKWRFDQDKNIQLVDGDVLITKDGTIGKVAIVDSMPGPSTLNSGVFVLRPKHDAYDSGFIYWMLRSRVFEEFVAGLSAGSTITHLYQRDLVTLELLVPPTLDEQAAISRILTDADADIEALERRLQSARAVKSGMMQELLTGRTRLPVMEES